jgi:hypothetical protein
MKRKVPDKADWDGYKEDLDVRHFHKLAFGKTIDDIQQYFGGGRAIERADELLFAPRAVFQYYVFAFVKFLMGESGEGESDAASPFLSLLEEREKKDPGSVSEIYSELSEVVDFITSHQEYFDAEVDIYGLFSERAERIRRVCNDLIRP